MDQSDYLPLLDRALRFAAEHTDEQGRMVVEGEIDCKDSGWLVLGGVIRGMEAGWRSGAVDLKKYCRLWTLASVRVEDRRSAWTTFALLYALFLSGGREGEFAALFSPEEREEFSAFLHQIDMRYLMEASRNYCVAAALIEEMLLRFGWIGKAEVDPDQAIGRMMEAYLGDGFFNDDDSRGSREDRRIDAYSAEIIGLLLHYDELFDFRSRWHERIVLILKEFCESGRYLIDRSGELAKWGRSLRGEAEIKKVFLWEYASKWNLVDGREADGAEEALTSFFSLCGISAEGEIFRDKGENRGIWDEYTTHVQAQGYGIYGLAMALHASSSRHGPVEEVLARRESFLRYLKGPGILCANSLETGMHYVVPLKNRMTKNMFFWHNRITGETDVSVDVSAKFLPLPYFGRKMPAPYSGPEIPFLPVLHLSGGEQLVPRNLEVVSEEPECREGEISCRQRFHFCRRGEYEPAVGVYGDAVLKCRCDGLSYEFHFHGDPPEGCRLGITFFQVTDPSVEVEISFGRGENCWVFSRGGASIYGPWTEARSALFSFRPEIRYQMRWRHV